MALIRIGMVVEGPTEVEFIKRVVAPQYYENNCFFQASSLDGNIDINRLSSEMLKFWRSVDAVTSLVDFYGFKGKGEMSADELEQAVRGYLTERLTRDFDEKYLFPYVQVHEFEGLLFSDVKPFGHVFGNVGLVGELQRIRNHFASPEDINDSSRTAPSKRLGQLIPGYKKILHGAWIGSDIGLPQMQKECPRFDRWMAHIDNLAGK
jgi:hypothetical protein